MKATTHDQLGVAKNLGQGAHPIAKDTVFGVRSLQSDKEWNAAKCLRGEPTERELQPDHDLGRCQKPGSRNVVRRNEDMMRSFGCPTVRTDIPMKKLKSVADHQNYGDEPEAIDLLFPATYTELNVTESEFLKVRPADELRTVFEKIGYSYKDGKFNAIMNLSARYSRDMLPQSTILPANYSTTRGMMLAINDLHEIE